MNYYYDVLLNFDGDNVWNFYEWEESDFLLFVKRIPLFRVSYDTMYDFLKYQVRLSDRFLEQIKNQTILKDVKEEENFYFILSDSKNSIAIKLNESGKVVSMSKLLIRDENNLNEFIYTLSEKKIDYEILSKKNYRHELRQFEQVKQSIYLELNTLFKEDNIHKLRYFYYEIFHKEECSVEQMYHELMDVIEFSKNNELFHLDYLIRLSYHQV